MPRSADGGSVDVVAPAAVDERSDPVLERAQSGELVPGRSPTVVRRLQRSRRFVRDVEERRRGAVVAEDEGANLAHLARVEVPLGAIDVGTAGTSSAAP